MEIKSWSLNAAPSMYEGSKSFTPSNPIQQFVFDRLDDYSREMYERIKNSIPREPEKNNHALLLVLRQMRQFVKDIPANILLRYDYDGKTAGLLAAFPSSEREVSSADKSRWENYTYINYIATDPSYKGCGIALMEAIVGKSVDAGSYGIYLNPTTTAEGFYQKLGFKFVNPNYMTLKIDESDHWTQHQGEWRFTGVLDSDYHDDMSERADFRHIPDFFA